MSGGKGGSQTQTTEMTIPDYLQEPIKRNIARAEDIAQIGFVPYMGPEVAALTPMQEASMQSTGTAAEAYGLANALGNQVAPQPQTFAGGMQGYSSFPLYEQALSELQAARPGQYDAIMNQFIDPVSGASSSSGKGGAQSLVLNTPEPSGSSSSGNGGGSTRDRDRGGSSSDYMRDNQMTSGSSGGFTSVRDMFDDGGAGSSGDTFKGGPFSGSLNRAGVRPVRGRS